MYDYKQIDQMIAQWRDVDKLSKPEIVVRAARACVGMPYIFGAAGQVCTVKYRRSRISGGSMSDGDRELIRKRCQQLNTSAKSSCAGCKYYPNGVGSRSWDCRGFTRWLMAQVGISLMGAGCTSQWNTKKNWAVQGTIDQMPKDKVCLIFAYDKNTRKYEHTLVYDGNGRYIHCSVEVKDQATSAYRKATHYGIPVGLYDSPEPGPGPEPTPTPTPTHSTLKKGMQGEEVREMQSILLAKGYDLGKYGADGKFGNVTLAAVKKFQTDSGLKADGIVGKLTWAALLA